MVTAWSRFLAQRRRVNDPARKVEISRGGHFLWPGARVEGAFRKSPGPIMIDEQFTLGVEEEYQIVHPETRDLRSYVSRLIEDGKSVLRERVRPEMHQSMVEVGTTICKDVGAVRSELCEMRGELDKLARKG